MCALMGTDCMLCGWLGICVGRLCSVHACATLCMPGCTKGVQVGVCVFMRDCGWAYVHAGVGDMRLHRRTRLCSGVCVEAWWWCAIVCMGCLCTRCVHTAYTAFCSPCLSLRTSARALRVPPPSLPPPLSLRPCRRLCPANKQGVRTFAPVMLDRLQRLGIDKTNPDELTPEEVRCGGMFVMCVFKWVVVCVSFQAQQPSVCGCNLDSYY